MTDQELQDLRRVKWRLDGRPVHTLEDARSFLESVGFCLMYPQKPPLLAPTFVGAWVGSDDRLPPWQQVFADPRAQEATELMVRLLRERDAYEANLFGENNPFLIASSIFPYFYALAGERNPKQPPQSGPRSEYSNLACDTFAAIQRGGPISKVKLQETLGGSISTPALDHALGELGVKLRITRVDYNPSEGSVWDVLYRWSPDAVREGMELSVATALSALLTKYLDCVIAADQTELESFFGNFASRSRIREAVNALLSARELEFVYVGSRSLIQITPPKPEPTIRVSAVPRHD
jgi:23S rRNA pseudouridine2605 synthase